MKTTVSIFIVLSLTFILVSCGGDDEASCASLETQTSVLLITVFQDVITYDADSTTVNCQKLKSSLEDLLIKAEKFRKCVPEADKVGYDEDIQNFEDSLMALPC